MSLKLSSLPPSCSWLSFPGEGATPLPPLPPLPSWAIEEKVEVGWHSQAGCCLLQRQTWTSRETWVHLRTKRGQEPQDVNLSSPWRLNLQNFILLLSLLLWCACMREYGQRTASGSKFSLSTLGSRNKTQIVKIEWQVTNSFPLSHLSVWCLLS